MMRMHQAGPVLLAVAAAAIAASRGPLATEEGGPRTVRSLAWAVADTAAAFGLLASGFAAGLAAAGLGLVRGECGRVR